MTNSHNVLWPKEKCCMYLGDVAHWPFYIWGSATTKLQKENDRNWVVWEGKETHVVLNELYKYDIHVDVGWTTKTDPPRLMDLSNPLYLFACILIYVFHTHTAINLSNTLQEKSYTALLFCQYRQLSANPNEFFSLILNPIHWI